MNDEQYYTSELSKNKSEEEKKIDAEKSMKYLGIVEVNGNFVPKNEVIPISKTDSILNAYDKLNKTKEEDICSYGYDFLSDKLIGIFKGDLVIVGSETGGGKTTFVNHIANYNAKQNKKIAIFSLEDDSDNLMINSLYFEINKLREKEGYKSYPYKEFRLNKLGDIEGWKSKAYESIRNDNIQYFKRADDSIMTEKELLNKLKQIKNEFDLVIIDHLHYVNFEKSRSRAEEIENFMKNLSSITINEGLSVILVAHYKKLGGAKPTDESFKDSQAIPHNATTTIHIWRDRSIDEDESGEDEEENFINLRKYETEFFIQKSRMPFGTGSVKAYFNPTTNNYDNNEEWKSGSNPQQETKVSFGDKF